MSSYEPTDIRQRAAKTIEIQEPLLDGGDSKVQQRIKRPRPSLILRILIAIKWIIIVFIISWYFDALQGINQVLEKDTLKRKIFYISLLALLSMLLIFIYLQYYIPFTKKASPPKYSSWNTDDTLKKFIPIATFMGLIGVVGLLFSFCHIWGFFGTPLVIFSALKSIIHNINIL
ncbi:hypothetical protein RhiirC2_349416 [Rhizophagus irregularis]|uniref:Transmembrane protein n=1 Tax=Rhizophagus irregularis TaxID=588596 RepID=A0A2N1P0D8_9GLOM|nr:hypothetical protein RhiirC2_349416 [Rhizophagus irregularis]